MIFSQLALPPVFNSSLLFLWFYSSISSKLLSMISLFHCPSIPYAKKKIPSLVEFNLFFSHPKTASKDYPISQSNAYRLVILGFPYAVSYSTFILKKSPLLSLPFLLHSQQVLCGRLNNVVARPSPLPKNVHVLMQETCEYATLYGKRTL